MKQKELELSPGQWLALLRRLDGRHPWTTPDERRLCLGCGRIIRGWDVRIRRGIGGLGTLRLRCSSKGCQAGPAEWVLPDDTGGVEMAAHVALARAAARGRNARD